MAPKKANSSKSKYKKAPGAPKRFKSAFMYFSECRHKQIRDESLDKKVLASEVAKVVSREWKSLAAEDKTQYEAMASKDRDRYYREKAAYKGPWKIPNVKDPRAPKKPMSAFLAFSNERRKGVAEANPGMGNGEISGVLSKLWKEAPEEIKSQYREREAEERKKFKVAFAEWEKRSSLSTGSSDEDEDSQLQHGDYDDGGSRGSSRGGDGSSQCEQKKPPAQPKESEHSESLPSHFHQQQSSLTHSHLTMFRNEVGSAGRQLVSQSTNQLSMFGNAASDMTSLFPTLPPQQQLLTLPPGPIPHQRLFTLSPGSTSLPFFDAPFTGLPNIQQSTCEREMIPSNLNAIMFTQTQNPAATTMEDYRSLDPFIDTDTGGYLAAFAALEKGNQNKSDQSG